MNDGDNVNDDEGNYDLNYIDNDDDDNNDKK